MLCRRRAAQLSMNPGGCTWLSHRTTASMCSLPMDSSKGGWVGGGRTGRVREDLLHLLGPQGTNLGARCGSSPLPGFRTYSR